MTLFRRTPSRRTLKNLVGATALATIIGLGAGMAVAATQGDLDTTSTGTTDITLTIDQFIQITDVNDLALGTFDGVNPLTANDDVCIFANTVDDGSIDYIVTATSSTGSYLLNGTSTADTVDFSATWTGDGLPVALVHGVPSLQFTSTHSGLACTGGTNANIQVDVLTAAMLGKEADDYSATLTLLITPN